MHKIDYTQVIRNLEEMINSLEYDSMRSPGKAKMNCANINEMYKSIDRYQTKLKAPAKARAAKAES